jgi:hypothetical protein
VLDQRLLAPLAMRSIFVNILSEQLLFDDTVQRLDATLTSPFMLVFFRA